MRRWLCSRGDVPPKAELGVYAPDARSAAVAAVASWYGERCEVVFVAEPGEEIQVFEPSPWLLDYARFGRGPGWYAELPE